MMSVIPPTIPTLTFSSSPKYFRQVLQTISRTPTRGLTYIYDPGKREFVDVFPQPFIPGWAVSGLCVSTPHGIYNYLTHGDHRS